MNSVRIISICLITALISCEYNEVNNCNGDIIQVSYETFLPMGVSEQCWLQNLNEDRDSQGRLQQQVDLVIQTQTDYEKYFGCSDTLPKIDFTKKTLLAGRYIALSSSFVLDQNVSKDCNQNYFFNIQLNPGISHAYAKIYYSAIIPKISNNAKVTVNVTYKGSCNSDSTLVAVEELLPSGDYQNGCFLKNLNDISNGLADLIVIQTQAEYEKYVGCVYSVPTIDFQKKTLLAGRYVAPNAVHITQKSAYVDCNGNYFLNVHLLEGGAAVISRIYFFAVISKIPEQSKAGISITYN